MLQGNNIVLLIGVAFGVAFGVALLLLGVWLGRRSNLAVVAGSDAGLELGPQGQCGGAAAHRLCDAARERRRQEMGET